MKKINLLFFTLTALVIFSCNNSTEEIVKEAAVEEVVEMVETPKAGIPNFENADLTAFSIEFSAFFDKSMDLLKSGDMEGLAAIESEGKALQVKSEALKSSLSEGDKALLEEYLKGKATEMLSSAGLGEIGEKMEKETAK